MSHRHAVVSVVVVVAGAALIGAPPASAQDAAPAKTIIAIATADIPINQHVEKTNAAVKAAIERSQVKAGPAAVALALAEAQRLAAAAGFTLGALQSLAEVPPSPFGSFSNYGVNGTLGPEKWCGQITTVRFVTRNGKRKRTTRRHFGCRIPREASQTVSATFAAT
jgi:hypothetical protein